MRTAVPFTEIEYSTADHCCKSSVLFVIDLMPIWNIPLCTNIQLPLKKIYILFLKTAPHLSMGFVWYCSLTFIIAPLQFMVTVKQGVTQKSLFPYCGGGGLRVTCNNRVHPQENPEVMTFPELYRNPNLMQNCTKEMGFKIKYLRCSKRAPAPRITVV